jgi:hypothetical protein
MSDQQEALFETLDDEEFLKEFERIEAQKASNSKASESGVQNEAQSLGDDGNEGEEAGETGGADDSDLAGNDSYAGEDSSVEESGDKDGNDDLPKGTGGVRNDPHQGSSTNDTDPDGEEDSTELYDAEATVNQLMAPLKAAKRTINIDSVDKARQLMQMGVDYSRKMADIKPYQRMIKSLERADLLDENKLNFVIDLMAKKPEAIQKLLQDSEVDPLDLDLEEGSTYRPNDNMVPENELAFDAVLDEIRPSPHFEVLITTVQSWDKASKQTLLDNPDVLRHLTAHMETGIYDMIVNRIEEEKIFGKHTGLSDLDVYKAVGDAMHAEGAFNTAPNQAAPSASGESNQGSSQDSQGSNDSKRKAKRRAASTPKGTPPKTSTKLPDFSRMTDEEVENFDWSSTFR